ncbi:carbon-nitrogen hydrolase [bacterium]|nr:MAG: carbon-nitrogen hydrolase [bacterium]
MAKVKLGLVQTVGHQNPEKNLQNHLQKIREAAQKGAQIICLQEMFNTIYFCHVEDEAYFEWAQAIPGPISNAMSDLAKELGVVLIVPYFEKRAPGIYHNTAAVIDADGTYLGKYRKMHIPDDPGFYEKFYFTPGDIGFKIFETKFATIGVLICWDQWYPEAARLTAMHGAEILFYPTAIGTLEHESEQEKVRFRDAWQTIQRSHSIANGCYVASVNRIGVENGTKFWGHSFVSAPFGEVIAQAGDQEEILVAEVDIAKMDAQRRIWPFFRDRRIDEFGDLTKRYLVD